MFPPGLKYIEMILVPVVACNSDDVGVVWLTRIVAQRDTTTDGGGFGPNHLSVVASSVDEVEGLDVCFGEVLDLIVPSLDGSKCISSLDVN
jgi:hypothetical protein